MIDKVTNIKDHVSQPELAIVQKMAKSVMWDLLYHEAELPKSHRKVNLIKDMIKRHYPKINIDEIDAIEDDYEPIDAEDYMRYEYACALDGIQHHEEYLRRAHEQMAGLTALIMRGGYAIDLEQIRSEQAKRIEEVCK